MVVNQWTTTGASGPSVVRLVVVVVVVTVVVEKFQPSPLSSSPGLSIFTSRFTAPANV